MERCGFVNPPKDSMEHILRVTYLLATRYPEVDSLEELYQKKKPIGTASAAPPKSMPQEGDASANF
jgi:hypothetical protein